MSKNQMHAITAPQGTVSVSEIIRYIERKKDCYLTTQGAAEYLGLNPREASRLIPANLQFRIGHRVRYRKSELDKWMAESRLGRSPQDLDRLVDSVLREVKK